MNRKICLALGFVVMAVISLGGLAYAGPSNVSMTIHNLSDDFTGFVSPYATDEDEVCIFCHTPHGGVTTNPLWNRQNPAAGGFTHYSSQTLTTVANNGARAVNNESLACLSCHDGSIATNRVLNPSNDIGQPLPEFGSDTFIITGWNGPLQVPGAQIGASMANISSNTDLSDDHPISLSYVDVYAEDPVGLVDPTVLEADASPDKVRFFGAGSGTAGGMRIECSTCHDPHVDQYDFFLNPGGDPQYVPFLVMSNSGSDLCLSCHVK